MFLVWRNVTDSQQRHLFQTLVDHTIDGELFTFQCIVAVFPNRECQLLILTIQLWGASSWTSAHWFSLVNLAQPRPTIGKYFCSTMSRRFSSAMVLPRIMRDCSSWISGADSGDELGSYRSGAENGVALFLLNLDQSICLINWCA